MAVYKEGQGRITRVCSVLIMALVGAFAGNSWFRWKVSIDDLSSGMSANMLLNPALLVGVLLFLGLTLLGAYLAFFRSGTSEFLIDVDSEMRKVVWPDVLPLFDPKAQAWGSTYVVIVTTVICTIYIGLVDTFFEWALARHLLVWLLAN